jgi:D-lactate dehydrogenase (cytochrome)
VTVEQLNKFLERKGLRFPHHPESRITATIAGAVCINGISPYLSKFGRPGDQVVGLKVVLANGQVYEIGNKTLLDNVFRMKNLFIGTEGSIGIIAELTLKVYQIPESRMMDLFGFRNLDEISQTLQKIVDAGLMPEAVMIPERQRIYNEALLPLLSTVNVSEILEDNEQFVLIVYSGDEAVVRFSMEKSVAIIKSNGGTKIEDHRVVESYWENLTLIGAVVTPQMNAAYGGRKYNSIRGGIPIRALTEYNKAVRKAFPSGDKLIDAGITSYVFLPQLDAIQICGVLLNDNDPESIAQFNDLAGKICKLSKKFSGTISASGAIGTLLRDFREMEMSSSEEIANKMKNALDPDHLMNPGKMF